MRQERTLRRDRERDIAIRRLHRLVVRRFRAEAEAYADAVRGSAHA